MRADRLAAIAGFIRDLAPDVVTLQEVSILSVDGVVTDQPAEIARLTGLSVRYGAVHAYPLIEPESGRTIGAAMWGNAILTPAPLRDAFVRGLPRAGDEDVIEPFGADHRAAGVRYADADPGHREPRCVIGGVAGDPPVRLATTHLTYIGREQRAGQASAARAFADVEPDAAAPFILTGDFNAPIDDPELERARDGLVDAFTAVGIPLGDDRRRSCGPLAIDHVLVRGFEVRACRIATEAGELSDHWPVVVDLAPA